MLWQVSFFGDFAREFDEFPEEVQDVIYSRVVLLEKEGPMLNRPYVDTLKGSSYSNMKELRCPCGLDVWRVAFAFDPDRRAILLTAGNKVGRNQNRFYESLIKLADNRFGRHLQSKRRRKK